MAVIEGLHKGSISSFSISPKPYTTEKKGVWRDHFQGSVLPLPPNHQEGLDSMVAAVCRVQEFGVRFCARAHYIQDVGRSI